MNEQDAALICKTLGDPNRLKIVKILADGEKCACVLLEAFQITQPTLSHHMKILCSCNLVQASKEGKWSHYTLNRRTFDEFISFITKTTTSPNDEKENC